MGGVSSGSSSSQSDPKDVTPEAFKALQGPFAQVLAQLIGFAPVAPLEAGQLGSAPPEGPVPVRERGLRDEAQAPVAATFSGGTKKGDQPTFAPAGDLSDILRGIPTAPGPFVAEARQHELDILETLRSGDPSTSVDLLTRTAEGAFLRGAEGGGNPFLTSAIEAAQRTSLQGLEEVLSRTLPGRFTQGGQFVQPQGSSAFDRAAALATRGVADEITDIASTLSFAGFESERERQQEAARAIPEVSAIEINSLLSNLQAQALPRLIEQAGLQAGTDQFNRQVTNLLQVLAIAQGASSPLVAQESTSSGKQGGVQLG